MLEFFNEGQVYEVILVTRSNATPVGVVRRGRKFFFRLFGGKSAEELREWPQATIQITGDVELLVKLALNMDVALEFEGREGYRWIRNLPGFYGRVEVEEEEHEDELGKARTLLCFMEPLGYIPGKPAPRPLSRADFHLLEMAIHLTRLPVALRNGRGDVAKDLYEGVMLNYRAYKRFGGSSAIARRMAQEAEKMFRDSGRFPKRETSDP
ncbi:hypothetical protein A3L12_06940 [Thermococcus sp. P6]|uniref:DUF447 domain-containing protein n=1 Tax=Thermococcus sp. P6 TaxID=122420 RepID=UPI000B59E79C|nr:DUF447 domain-containing protein [Thermococcus sp. P6]ASJ11053.1 hypothetical protein A3L12_06940 [Thermococcus sp. P6]